MSEAAPARLDRKNTTVDRVSLPYSYASYAPVCASELEMPSGERSITFVMGSLVTEIM